MRSDTLIRGGEQGERWRREMKAKEDGESMEEWNEMQWDGVGVELPRVV